MALGQGSPDPAGGVSVRLLVRPDWRDEGDEEALDMSLRCHREKETVGGLLSLW